MVTPMYWDTTPTLKIYLCTHVATIHFVILFVSMWPLSNDVYVSCNGASVPYYWTWNPLSDDIVKWSLICLFQVLSCSLDSGSFVILFSSVMYFVHPFPLTPHIRGHLLSLKLTLLHSSDNNECLSHKRTNWIEEPSCYRGIWY